MRVELLETVSVDAPRAVMVAGTRGEAVPLYEGSPLLMFHPDRGRRKVVVRASSIRVLDGLQP